MSFYNWTTDNRNLDENKGIDIDNNQYDSNYNFLRSDKTAQSDTRFGDYEVYKNPRVSGMSPQITKLGSSLSDYGHYDDGGEKVFYMKSYLAGDQKDSMGNIVDNINNGRVNDITETKISQDMKDESDVVISRDNNDTSVKGLLEKTALSDMYFSDVNMGVLQDTIRYKVNQETESVIDRQSNNELYVVMRSMLLQYGNFRVAMVDVVEEIKRLNQKVIDYCVQNISSHVNQYNGYIKDLSNLPVPLDRPVYHNKQNYTYDISNILQ